MQHPVDDCRQRVDALETWHQWAIGGNIDGDSLQRALEALTTAHGINHTWTNQLADSLQQWVTHHQGALGHRSEPELGLVAAGAELDL